MLYLHHMSGHLVCVFADFIKDTWSMSAVSATFPVTEGLDCVLTSSLFVACLTQTVVSYLV